MYQGVYNICRNKVYENNSTKDRRKIIKVYRSKVIGKVVSYYLKID